MSEPYENDDEFAPWSDISPGVPLFGVRIVQFISDDGTIEYDWEAVGEISNVTFLGMMEFVKQSYVKSMLFEDAE